MAVEGKIQRAIQTALTDADTRLWRNNTGTAWQGRVVRNRDGSITIYEPRRVTFGLAPGSSDLIGLRSVVVTPDMVGRRLAVFAAVEVKSSERARRTAEQRAFVQVVQELGGAAGFAWTVEGAREVMAGGLAGGSAGVIESS